MLQDFVNNVRPQISGLLACLKQTIAPIMFVAPYQPLFARPRRVGEVVVDN
jgi:hypothetical protein